MSLLEHIVIYLLLLKGVVSAPSPSPPQNVCFRQVNCECFHLLPCLWTWESRNKSEHAVVFKYISFLQ